MITGVYLFEYDATTKAPVLGDAANITGSWSADGGAATDGFITPNPTEIGGGLYWQPLAAIERIGEALAYYWVSSTSGATIDPVMAYLGLPTITPDPERANWVLFAVRPNPDKAGWILLSARPDPDRSTWVRVSTSPDPDKAGWIFNKGT